LIEILLVKNGTAIAIATAASRSIQGPEAEIGVAVTSPPTMYCGGLEEEGINKNALILITVFRQISRAYLNLWDSSLLHTLFLEFAALFVLPVLVMGSAEKRECESIERRRGVGERSWAWVLGLNVSAGNQMRIAHATCSTIWSG
jgi:hypothetical protein